jgi:signal transduction histidine kinase
MFLAESKLLQQTVSTQYTQMQVTLKLMNKHLYTLEKDVAFLSSLDVMDEILSDDLDKKISRLLEKKAKDIGEGATLFVINKKHNIIAASNAALLLQNLSFTLPLYKKGYFIRDKKLYIYAQIFASFEPSKPLGFLLLSYNLDNLQLFLIRQQERHSYIVNNKENISIGKNLHVKIDFTQNAHSLITEKYVLVYKKIAFFQHSWYLVYAVNKSTALESLYDFITFILAASLLLGIIVLYMAYKRSQEIIEPIAALTTATDEITKTQNYSKEIQTAAKSEEILLLTQAFNSMLQTTASALLKLEDESKRRLTQFTDLINLFNTIIQTQHEDDCITSSIKQIKQLSKNKNLHFQRHKAQEKKTLSLDLYVTNFQQNKKEYYGTILLGFKAFYDVNEEKFYTSIAAMITLQLERIRLIKNTLSVSKAKSAFISNMSHELRTPLNAIISATQLLLAYEKMSEQQQDSIANIESSAHYLLEMINGILDIAKIEAGKMRVEQHLADITALTQQSIDILSPLANDKNLQLFFKLPKNKKIETVTDAKILQQIIINLLSNAVKFTQKGSITLTLTADEKKVYFTITDTGIGISPQNIQRLFNDFTQLENIMQKQHKGTGIGLSLSQKMAHLLGGDIKIESEGLTKGTSVTLYIIKNQLSST